MALKELRWGRNRWLALVLMLGLALGVASCGGGESSDSSTADTSPPQEPVESASATEYSPPTFTANFWVTEYLEQSDGSTSRQRFGLGDLAAADQFDPPSGYESLVATCEVDRKRDALIPGVLIAEDTTERFPIELSSGIVIERPFQEGYADLGPETSMAQAFSSGPSCEPGGELENTEAEVTFSLAHGETGRHRFLIVVHNYYSPRHPQGDAESLGFLRVGFFPTLYTGWEPTCISASAPLEDGFARPDGKPIGEADSERYETKPHALGSAGVDEC